MTIVMMGYSQLVISARKMKSEVADVKEVMGKAASVEVTSTGNGGELVALTQQVAYLMSTVENKNKFSKEKGNQKNKKNETRANNGQLNSNEQNANSNNEGINGNQNHNQNQGRKANRSQLQCYRCKGLGHFVPRLYISFKHLRRRNNRGLSPR